MSIKCCRKLIFHLTQFNSYCNIIGHIGGSISLLQQTVRHSYTIQSMSYLAVKCWNAVYNRQKPEDNYNPFRSTQCQNRLCPKWIYNGVKSTGNDWKRIEYKTVNALQVTIFINAMENYDILFMKIRHVISRTTGPNIGMFVLILMYVSCLFH